MSRFEGDFAAAGDASLSANELIDLLAGRSGMSGRARREAIACYLSAGEGWDEALKTLRGAFASDAAESVRSSAAKGNEQQINHPTSEYLQWQALKPAGTNND